MTDDPFEGSPYRAMRRLGAGGMGELFVVVHHATGRQFVGKILRAEWASDSQLADRLRVEAQSLGRLSHPNVVSVAAVGNALDGRPFIIMEYLTGRSLSVVLAQRGQLPVLEALRYACELLSALGAAHALGIVHRDVKPDNLFICVRPEGEPYLKLLDFGVARILPGAPAHAPAPLGVPTDTGAMIGTPRYVSPEGALVEKDVDQRADVYSAALVLYLMLVGRGPFDHLKGVESLRSAHALEDPEPPSRFARGPMPPELDRAILKALRKNRAERFDTAEDFQEALEQVADWLRKPSGWLETIGFRAVSPSESEHVAARLPRGSKQEPAWHLDPSIQVPATWSAADRHVTASSAISNNESLIESGSRVRVARAADEDEGVAQAPAKNTASLPSRRGITLVFLLTAVATAALVAACVFALGRAGP